MVKMTTTTTTTNCKNNWGWRGRRGRRNRRNKTDEEKKKGEEVGAGRPNRRASRAGLVFVFICMY